MNRRHVVLSALASLPAIGHPALVPARTRLVYGYTAVTDFASLFMAAEQGYFDAQGIDIELKLIPLNSTLPAAIEAGSLQMGGPTASVFLQAVAGGLDHVAVAGASVTSKTNTGVGLVARAGSGIRSAQDCVGRRIGVPGLGAYLHLTFRAWLSGQGVDPAQVRFVETPFPQQADLLRGGSVDGVVTADPFMQRILDGGIGLVVAYHTTFLPDGLPILLHTAQRAWARNHPAVVRGFQAAIQRGVAYMRQPGNDAAVRAAIAKYTRLPAEVVARIQISRPGPTVSSAGLRYWVDLMRAQGMLQDALPTERLLAPSA